MRAAGAGEREKGEEDVCLLMNEEQSDVIRVV